MRINRNNLFYSSEDFDLETDLLIDYIERDTNQTVVVYEIDHNKLSVSNVYNTSKSKPTFKTPKEIPCHYEITDNQLKTFDSKTANGVYSINGELTLYVMPKILERYECDIKRGDYIGVLIEEDRMVYFSVIDDGKVNTANSYVVGAYKTAWRKIRCAPTTLQEFNGE